jgi:hypothetical protein
MFEPPSFGSLKSVGFFILGLRFGLHDSSKSTHDKVEVAF